MTDRCSAQTVVRQFSDYAVERYYGLRDRRDCRPVLHMIAICSLEKFSHHGSADLKLFGQRLMKRFELLTSCLIFHARTLSAVTV